MTAGCIQVIFLYKSRGAERLCHFAVTLLSCSDSVTICEGILVSDLKMQIVDVNFCLMCISVYADDDTFSVFAGVSQ